MKKLRKSVVYKITTPGLSSFHPTTFYSAEEAIEVMDAEYTNRNKGDGYDEYWRKRHSIVVKETKVTEFFKSNKE